MSAPNFFARGDINPCRFVKSDTATNFGVLQAAANDPIIGVSQEGTRRAPGLDGSDSLAAKNGEGIQVFTDTDECLITYGGTVTAGDYLKSDASGQAIKMDLTTVTGVQHYGGKAIESGSSGDKRRILVTIGVLKES